MGNWSIYLGQNHHKLVATCPPPSIIGFSGFPESHCHQIQTPSHRNLFHLWHHTHPLSMNFWICFPTVDYKMRNNLIIIHMVSNSVTHPGMNKHTNNNGGGGGAGAGSFQKRKHQDEESSNGKMSAILSLAILLTSHSRCIGGWSSYEKVTGKAYKTTSASRTVKGQACRS